MNIPVGEIVEENIALSEVKFEEKLLKLSKEAFTGYLVLTVEGRSGIEEGLLLFKGGLAVGAIYEYVKFKKMFYGDNALEQLLNAVLAEFGVMDIVGLSRQQVDLIIAFNEKVELRKPLSQKEITKIIPKQYQVAVAEKALGKELKKKESKFDVFKKLGLGGLGK